MNILVFSDTHGKIDRAENIFHKVSARTEIAMIFHCGDYQRDADALAAALQVPVIGVPGNCDGSVKRDFQTVTLPSGKVMLIHGHTEGVDWEYNRISLLAEEHGCMAVCFGHTHVPVNDGPGRVYLINPGSLTRPRGGSRASCALITSEPGHFDAEILYYDEVMDGTWHPASPESGADGSSDASGNSDGNDHGNDHGSGSDNGGGRSDENRGPSGKSGKRRGGFLKKILNYSDGQ